MNPSEAIQQFQALLDEHGGEPPIGMKCNEKWGCVLCVRQFMTHCLEDTDVLDVELFWHGEGDLDPGATCSECGVEIAKMVVLPKEIAAIITKRERNYG